MYGFSVTIDSPFAEAIVKVTEALRQEGFGVLSDIDVQATLKAKLGVDTPAYRILGACNPQLAHRALGIDPDVGLLLPCNVIARAEADGRTTIGFMDPAVILQLADEADLLQLGKEVRARLERVRDSLT